MRGEGVGAEGQGLDLREEDGVGGFAGGEGGGGEGEGREEQVVWGWELHVDGWCFVGCVDEAAM